MPQNFIRHPGISALASALVHNPGLRVLNLNDNTFTWRGSHAVAQALPQLQKLSILNFGDCLIRTKGAEFLAKALSAGHENLTVSVPCFVLFNVNLSDVTCAPTGSLHGSRRDQLKWSQAVGERIEE